MGKYYVYILSNQRYTVLYTGFTDDLERRVNEHKNQLLEGFTKKYKIDKLLYFEEFNSSDEAKHREIQLKKYKREFKRNLINSINPTWRDLLMTLNKIHGLNGAISINFIHSLIEQFACHYSLRPRHKAGDISLRGLVPQSN